LPKKFRKNGQKPEKSGQKKRARKTENGLWTKKVGKSPKILEKTGREKCLKMGLKWLKTVILGPFWGVLR